MQSSNFMKQEVLAVNTQTQVNCKNMIWLVTILQILHNKENLSQEPIALAVNDSSVNQKIWMKMVKLFLDPEKQTYYSSLIQFCPTKHDKGSSTPISLTPPLSVCVCSSAYL